MAIVLLVLAGLALGFPVMTGWGWRPPQVSTVVPDGLLALSFVLYVAVRHSHAVTGLLTGAFSAAVWVGLHNTFPELVRGYPALDGLVQLAVIVGAGTSFGLLASLLAQGARVVLRRPATVRQDAATAGARFSTPLLVLAIVILLALFWDSFGWGFQRLYDTALLWHALDGTIWSGWRWVLSWERTIPVVLGMLAAWMMLQQKNGYTRITRAYLLVSAAFGLARFFAWQLARLDRASPGPLSLVGLDWSAITQGFVDVTDRAAFIEGWARVLLAIVGIVFLLPAATRRLRPPAGVS